MLISNLDVERRFANGTLEPRAQTPRAQTSSLRA